MFLVLWGLRYKRIFFFVRTQISKASGVYLTKVSVDMAAGALRANDMMRKLTWAMLLLTPFGIVTAVFGTNNRNPWMWTTNSNWDNAGIGYSTAFFGINCSLLLFTIVGLFLAFRSKGKMHHVLQYNSKMHGSVECEPVLSDSLRMRSSDLPPAAPSLRRSQTKFSPLRSLRSLRKRTRSSSIAAASGSTLQRSAFGSTMHNLEPKLK
jgi:hypothetical protein